MCAIITPTHILCANVGDSRCVLGGKNNIVTMTDDHKPNAPEEKERVCDQITSLFIETNSN